MITVTSVRNSGIEASVADLFARIERGWVTTEEAGLWARNIAHVARAEAKRRARQRIASQIRRDIYRDAGMTRSRFGGWE